MPPLMLVKPPVPSPLMVDPQLPADPALRTLIDDVLAKLKYSFAAAAADDAAPAKAGALDHAFSEFLASRSQSSRAQYQEHARALANAAPAAQAAHFRRYATLAVRDYRAIGSDGLVDKFGHVAVDGAALAATIRKMRGRMDLQPARPPIIHVEHPINGHHADGPIKVDPDFVNGLMFHKMRLFVREVRCIEETDEIGSDEINVGGTSIDPFGTSSLRNQFVVSKDFDEGEAVGFGDPGKTFTTWELQQAPSGFPYVYGAVIVMAEKDDGGFYALLVRLWQLVSAEVKAAVTGAVGAAIGAAIGAALGSVVGALVGVLLGALIGWLISLFHNPDDIVGLKTLTMTLGSALRSYYDWAKLTTPHGLPFTLHFNGDGGRYEMDVAYKVFTT